MKIHLILIIGLVYGQNETELDLLIDDLSILARVTNGIALHNAAAGRSINLFDVITGLLRVDKKTFETAMSIDPTEASSVLTEFYEKSQRFVPNIRFSNDVSIMNAEKRIHVLLEMLSKVKLLRSAASGTEDIWTHFKNVLTPLEIERVKICDNDVLKVFSEFYLMGIDEIDHIEYRQVENIDALRDNVPKLLGCLKKFENYKSDVMSTNLVNAYLKLGNVQSLVRFIALFDATYDELSEVVKSMFTYQKIYPKTKELWKVSDKNASAIFSTLYEALDTMQLAATAEVSRLTVGFGFTDGLMKVFDDVKSDWFNKTISKGARTVELERSLTHFKHFAMISEEVGNNWTATITYFDELKKERQGHPLLKSSKYLNSLKNFDGASKKALDSSSISEFENCWKTAVNIVDETEREKFMGQIEKFYKGLVGPREMFAHLERLVRDVTEMNGNSLRTRFENALNKINYLLVNNDGRIYTENVVEFRRQLKSESHWPDLMEGLKIFHRIENRQRKMQMAIDTIDKSGTSFAVSSLVRNTKYVDTLECIDKRYTVAELQQILHFMIDIFAIGNPLMHAKAQELLMDISSLQDRMKEVERIIVESRKVAAKPIEFVHASELSTSFGKGVYSLRKMNEVGKSKEVFEQIARLSPRTIFALQQSSSPALRNLWLNPMEVFGTISQGIGSLVLRAKHLRENGTLFDMSAIFEEAHHMVGVPLESSKLKELTKLVSNVTEWKVLKGLSELNLDFSKYDLRGASSSLIPLQNNFDVLFGNVPKDVRVVQSVNVVSNNDLAIFLGIAVFFTICFGSFVIFAMTPSGRATCKNTYLYYFGKEADFEKRWRYSLFLDRLDGKNALIDAVREVNVTNVLQALKRGAYIDVYNVYGNTPLHAATKQGHPEIVKILIKNGADRCLLNSQNKLPRQMIPFNSQKTEKASSYEEIERIYEKYSNTSFRINVPEVFPVSSFHIYIEERTDNKLTNDFMDKFQSITSDEPLPTTTHCIVKTGEDGVLETDQLSLLIWIFNGVIIVKEKWMSDCLKDERLIRHDSKYLVEKVRYKGVLFENAVLPWSQAMAKGTMPFLHGVFVAVVMRDCPNLINIASLVMTQGGIMLNSFPQKDNYNRGSHPYLHSDLGPLFIIHDGQINLDAYKNDDMFSLFTEEQFVMFMLRRGVCPVPSPDPISVFTQSEFK